MHCRVSWIVVCAIHYVFGLAVVGTGRPAAAGEEYPQAPRVIGPFASAYFEEGFAAHGTVGDETILFTLQVSPAPGLPDVGIHVTHRLTGEYLGFVGTPHGDAPLILKVRSYEKTGVGTRGELILMEGFPPALVGLAPTYIHEYAYSWSRRRGLQVELIASHMLPMPDPAADPNLPPAGPLFPCTMDLLPSGAVVVADSLMGTAWVSDTSLESWRMVLYAPELAAGPLLEQVEWNGSMIPGVSGRVCDFDGNCHDYVLAFPSIPGMPPLAPGVHGVRYVAPIDSVAFVTTLPPGGIFSIPLSTLLDETLAPGPNPMGLPYKQLDVMVPPMLGVSDWAGDLHWDRWRPDSPWIYWQRGLAREPEGDNAMYRYNFETGELQLVVESASWYYFPTVLDSLPPLPFEKRYSLITSGNCQEASDPDLNALIDEPAYLAPTVGATVAVPDGEPCRGKSPHRP